VSAPEFLAKMEEVLGLPWTSVMAIRDEADWSFTIKIHAILETALNYALVKQLQNDRLAKLISYLPTNSNPNDTKAGKLGFIRVYEILPDNDCKFIASLSEARNRMAHESKNLGWTIEDWLKTFENDTTRNRFFASAAKVRATEVAEISRLTDEARANALNLARDGYHRRQNRDATMGA
jgi:hypothetical protein